MKIKLKRFFKNHSTFLGAIIWIGLILILLIDSFLTIYPIFNQMMVPPSTILIFSLMFTFFFLAVIGAGWKFIKNYFRQVLPIRELIHTGHILSERDFPALARGLSHLALGNLTHELHVHSKYPPDKIPDNIQPLSEALHILRDNLNVIVDDFNSITDTPCKRLGFIGSDPIADGKKSAEVLSKMLDNKGKILITTGFRFNAMLELRRKSFELWIRLNTDIEIVEVFESMMNLDFSTRYLEDLLKIHPDIKGIYATDVVTTSIIAEILTFNRKQTKIKLVGHDLNYKNVQHLKSGAIDALLDQNAYVQGHDAVIYLYNHLVEGWIPPKPQIFIPAEVITQQNINQYWHQSQKFIVPHDIVKHLAKPTETPPTKPYKIVLLGREDSEIWNRLHEGAMAARDELMSKNVILEWMSPDEAREKSDFSAMVYGKYIESLIQQKIDGLVTFVEDARLISSINRAVKAGIQVMTLNTEPLNLRSLIQTLNNQTSRLSNISKELAGTTQYSIISTTEIRNAISKIADGSITQNNHVNKTRTTLESLLNNIDQISRDANESDMASENTRKAVASGAETMQKTLTTLESIAGSVNNSWSVVEELRQHSNRIDDIVDILSTIASKVNILALNASIEATQSAGHEKRFGQVAIEIRKLAISTSEANREVAILIETLKTDIQQVQKTMQICVEMIKDTRNYTSETDTALENIKMLVESDRDRIQRITNSIREMQSMSHQVGYSMDQMVMASTKNSMSVNQVNTSIKDMVVRLEDVLKMAKQLEQMARSESEFLAMFETDDKAHY